MWLKGVGKEGGFQAFVIPHSISPVVLIYVLSQVSFGYNYEVSLCTDPTGSGHSLLMGKCVVLNQEKNVMGIHVAFLQQKFMDKTASCHPNLH